MPLVLLPAGLPHDLQGLDKALWHSEQRCRPPAHSQYHGVPLVPRIVQCRSGRCPHLLDGTLIERARGRTKGDDGGFGPKSLVVCQSDQCRTIFLRHAVWYQHHWHWIRAQHLQHDTILFAVDKLPHHLAHASRNVLIDIRWGAFEEVSARVANTLACPTEHATLLIRGTILDRSHLGLKCRKQVRPGHSDGSESPSKLLQRNIMEHEAVA
mmetsp:Transcript_129893/g.415467  ORF Transcript_129893/g.415467 Transcript_129893/m.415467 type:complete len:211 (-) Transcript_129893:227-859(-)